MISMRGRSARNGLLSTAQRLLAFLAALALPFYADAQTTPPAPAKPAIELNLDILDQMKTTAPAKQEAKEKSSEHKLTKRKKSKTRHKGKKRHSH
ncbi:MAG: hypothetical protein KGJ06_10080, partial [Pseudomonadota bacterium]|nr:hypothetical protein [Pseudomonadota bacterium]